MGKTILRVAEGIELTSTIMANLKSILGQDLTLETYSNTPNLENIYTKRIQILHQAFQFIVKAIPPKGNEKELKDYISWCLRSCNLSPCKVLSEYQDTLARFTALLVNGLLDYWDDFTSLEEAQAKEIAIEMLNRAEQYLIMKEGRPNLATLSIETTFNEPKLILQWDESLPPYTEETLNELKAIKNSNLWVTPDWFRQLSPIQQIFVHVNESQPLNKENLRNNLGILETLWKYVKDHTEQANLLKDLEIISEDKLPKPSWFSHLSLGHQKIFRELAAQVSKNGLNCVEYHLTEIGKSLDNIPVNKEVSEVPYWFLRLPAYEQLFLKRVLSETNNIADVVSYLPSRLRSLPLLANFGKHQLFLLYPNGQVKELGQARLRSSHLSSRDLEDEPAILGQEHSNRNVAQICHYLGKSRALFIQTLISPISLPSQILPDPILDKHRRHAIERLRSEHKEIKIYTSNHPFNIAKYLIYTSSYDQDCLELLNSVQEELRNITEQSKDLKIDDNFATHIACLIELSYTYPKIFKQIRQFIENPKLIEDIGTSAYERFIKQVFSENKIPVSFCSSLWPDKEFNKDNVIKSLDYLISLKGSNSLAFNLAKRLTDLAQICCEYNKVLNSGYGTATIFDYRCRELWLSSVENLIIILIEGLSYGSCVSGKDRKALEIIHTDAMLIYREIYGTWPSFFDNKEARGHFESIFVDLYITWHAHVHAGRNADGAQGIKTPANYLPKDIVEAIKLRAGKQSLTIDDTLATNNEVRRIAGIASYTKRKYARCVVAAMQLSESSIETLLETIKLLIGEKGYWQKQLNYRLFATSPKGITQIQKLFDDTITQSSSLEIKTRMLADIYYIVSERPDKSETRLSGTEAFYTCIRNLYASTDPEAQVNLILQQLLETKAKSFEDNIKETSQVLSN
ncbi:Dot/Icm T4SS effector PI-3-phosphatase SidP [Legionella gresilensis]|uniref:Dot/Icm T4SS effector PI-3-phosphatase SidP n=1 Tax=Legionella gresilensis TaxID=91823 RepID=UPI001041B810|nr:Dot/Icm T4SS effector PI-3-phosphatase SidP [Legionella gresilensis]